MRGFGKPSHRWFQISTTDRTHARTGPDKLHEDGGHTDDSLRNRSSFRNRNAPGPYVKTCCSVCQKVEPPHIMAIQLTTDPGGFDGGELWSQNAPFWAHSALFPRAPEEGKLLEKASLRAYRLATLSAPPRARAPPPPRSPSALASPPPQSRMPLPLTSLYRGSLPAPTGALPPSEKMSNSSSA